MKRLILGSNSPRRRELLSGLDLEFSVDTGNSFVEGDRSGLSPEEYPLMMSRGKSHGFHRPLEEDEVLITADTVVICSGEILEKPHTREDAIRMLKSLSGREHKVITAVTLRSCSCERSFEDVSIVDFRPLSDYEIAYYIDKYSPYDKAGAYGVQEWIGYVGISSIRGSFYNVMGLPVHRVWEELQNLKAVSPSLR